MGRKRQIPIVGALALVTMALLASATGGAAGAAAMSPAGNSAATAPRCGERCKGGPVPRLSPERARAAFQRRGAKRAGGPVRITLLERISGRAFFGTARWGELTSGDDGEQLGRTCFALMEARLGKRERVFVTMIETGCRTLPPPGPPEAHL